MSWSFFLRKELKPFLVEVLRIVLDGSGDGGADANGDDGNGRGDGNGQGSGEGVVVLMEMVAVMVVAIVLVVVDAVVMIIMLIVMVMEIVAADQGGGWVDSPSDSGYAPLDFVRGSYVLHKLADSCSRCGPALRSVETVTGLSLFPADA
ncbi:hypothetical protein PoB_003317900 [Plakobranchus ocellatus]|uniref:Uncharacterized protein n=1 Tax=Plakobranchus ocellatus TaxID=259542 RepID=A0AAV4AKC9_9GAST|nr:hypothetical protein PoB_003317900 [Plakobranchus ocellatus]